jgi:hypothetical protein
MCPAGVDNASCLTRTQVQWARKIYAGLKDPVDGQFWPGYEACALQQGLAGKKDGLSQTADYGKEGGRSNATT